MIVLILFIRSVRGWREKGHLISAYIAQEFLLQHSPDALDWSVQLLKPLMEECGEGKYPFVESSTYADKVKLQGWLSMYNHHFISYRWLAPGSKFNFSRKVLPEYGKMFYTVELDGYSLRDYYFNDTHSNLTYAIEQLTSHLTNSSKDVYGSSKSVLLKSLSLRMLIHFIGDIHQPLHASERISDDHPFGDRGGNDFKVIASNQTFALHHLWDLMLEVKESGKMVYNYSEISDIGKSITADHRLTSMIDRLANSVDPIIWAEESHEIARSFVYRRLTDNRVADDNYLTEGRELCRLRIAQAGYRIGMTITGIYRQSTSDDSFV